MRFGATPEQWQGLVDLGLTADLLPVVSNPDAKPSELSKMKDLGKTPSIYNRDGRVVGFGGWTRHESTTGHVEFWASKPDYGACIQTRHLRAIDIDIEDQQLACRVRDTVLSLIGRGMTPVRTRPGTGRMIVPFFMADPLFKRVIPVGDEAIEILGTGQQFIAYGTHPSGHPYQWQGLPAGFPTINGEQFDRLWAELVETFATGGPTIAREKRDRDVGRVEDVDDDVADWLVDNWEIHDSGPEGQLYMECPFADEHTADSGPTSTAYFPAGTGGFERGHFVCLHAHCAGRDDAEFIEATGYGAAQFEDLDAIDDAIADLGLAEYTPPPADEDEIEIPNLPLLPGVRDDIKVVDTERNNQWPRVTRAKGGAIEATALNLVRVCTDGRMIGRWIAYDEFTDELVWAHRREHFERANWHRVTDAEVTEIRMELETRGFKNIGAQILRDSLHAAGHRNKIDSAQVWLARHEWDGVLRVETFMIDCLGWDDTPYARAVGLYLWSAMAGRIIQPGVQADMAPILYGLQGIRKTTAIKAMVPHPDMYTEIRLDAKDDDQSRALRGKLIGEIEELRGLNSRAVEEIKAFISRRRESWVPKYKEFENHFWRRCILMGTTNEHEMLADPTGERRWLPGESKGELDVDRIIAERNQLWAEGAYLFREHGVIWEDAERLAKAEHGRFKISDSWSRAVVRWLDDEEIDGTKPMEKGYITVDEVMSGALGISTSQQGRAQELRVRRVLADMGFNRDIEGRWTR